MKALILPINEIALCVRVRQSAGFHMIDKGAKSPGKDEKDGKYDAEALNKHDDFPSDLP